MTLHLLSSIQVRPYPLPIPRPRKHRALALFVPRFPSSPPSRRSPSPPADHLSSPHAVTTDKRYEPTVSDHRPISAGFLVKVRKVQPQSRSAVLAEVRQVWEDEKVPVLLEEAKGFYGSL